MSGDDDDDQTPSRRNALAALVVVALLIVAVVLLIGRLQRDATIQDCVASGRTNCTPIEAPAR